MQERLKQNGRSPYLSALKSKDTTFFPKIQRAQTNEKQQFVAKSNRKNNYNQSIFKGKQQKIEIAKIQQLEVQKIVNSREYKQLQAQLQLLQKKHAQQLNEIQQKKQEMGKKIKLQQGNSYKNKYSLWELRNQIMELEATLREEENQLQRMEYELGFKQDQSEADSSIYQGNN